jgi:hypothetical protein
MEAVQPPPVFRDPRVDLLWRAWHGWRGNRPLPGRRDVDPAAIRPLLPNLVLLERLAGGRFRYRLAGEAVNSLFQTNLGGRFVDDALPPGMAERALQRYAQIADQRIALHLYGAANVRADLRMPSERLLLPLAGDGRAIDGVIALALFYDGGVGQGLLDGPPEGLPQGRPLWDDPIVTALALETATGLAA